MRLNFLIVDDSPAMRSLSMPLGSSTRRMNMPGMNREDFELSSPMLQSGRQPDPGRIGRCR